MKAKTQRDKTQRGFTLIEIMVTVAIVAILAAIALPNYSAYVQRGKIGEAIANLSSMHVNMEQYFLDNPNHSYVGGPCTTPPTGTYFTYSCVPTATTYTITATGVASQGMSGFSYTIDESNNRQTTGYPGTTVSTSSPGLCWYTKPSGC